MTRRRLVVIEDGTEYAEFARAFLSSDFEILAATSCAGALQLLSDRPADAFLVDLRFDRAPPEVLTGDLDATARRLFAGDRERALRWLQDQQGTLILGELRAAGHRQRAVFVHDMPARRLANLRQLHGDVAAVPTFDATSLRRALLESAR